MRLLFICKANKNRSLTAQHLVAAKTGHEVRSAGLLSESKPATDELLEWADVVFVFEALHERIVRQALVGAARSPRLINLEIPDAYLYGSRELVEALERALEPWWRFLAEVELGEGK